MKNIPKKLYLQIGEDTTSKDFNDLDHEYVTWCSDRTDKTDIEYELVKKKSTPPKSNVSAEEIIDKYFKYNEFDKKRVIEAMEEYRTQPAKFTPERTAEEEADRLAMKPLPISWYSEVITALQLRGFDTSYEESVLNILKGI